MLKLTVCSCSEQLWRVHRYSFACHTELEKPELLRQES
jgi:hypothetical protein